VLFFSLAGCKRPGYVLPAMPLLAMALADYLNRKLPHGTIAESLLQHNSRLACGASMLVLLVASGSCFLATQQRLIAPAVGISLGGCAISALLVWSWRCYGPRARASWLQCGGTTFCVLLLGLYLLLPGYARRFSMRGQVQPFALTCRDASLQVVCYPRGWDSVNFYLERENVQVFTPEKRRDLLASLVTARRTLLFVKTERALEELKRDLPDDLEFTPQGRQGTVRVGLVQPRGDRLVAHSGSSAP
jgi:hypothetical protein